jgi:serine/threonine-protein kinase HipA
MKCLCCGQEFNESSSEEELNNGWHVKCVRSFFGTKIMPLFDISEDKLEKLAKETVNKGLTVPGVQKKLSLHLSKDSVMRLTIVDYPTGYILKPQTEEFTSLPEAEQLCMSLANVVGIQTVPHGLVKINTTDTYAYITKRIDRNIKSTKKNPNVQMYAMEDFCQLSRRLTQDKYKGSYERCAKIIQEYSERPGLDLSELFLRIVFSFVTGNSDMHLKNFSLIEMNPGGRNFVLSKAYDLLPVNVIMPEDEEQLALTLNGKKKNIRKKDFFEFANNSEVSKKTAINLIERILSKEEIFYKMCDESLMPDRLKNDMKKLISERMTVLK